MEAGLCIGEAQKVTFVWSIQFDTVLSYILRGVALNSSTQADF